MSAVVGPGDVQGVAKVPVGPDEVQAACESALVELSGAFATSAVTGLRDQWATAIGAAQRVIDVASAAQDAAMARLAAIEPEFLDDGTVVESHRALGHVALDAPAIVSGVLVCSAVHAEGRVRGAVRLAGDGPAGSASETGLGGLHAAMRAGRLDAYRAGVVAQELERAPAQVAATVVAALEGHFGVEDGTHLRRRCRRVLTRISPDLLHQRAARARAESGLRRWADEPGVDRWEGTFPSEEAARAWAAIDALARQYVKDGVVATLERARAKALTDLVAGNATITTVLTVTVPAKALPDPDTTLATAAEAGLAEPEAAVTSTATGLPTADVRAGGGAEAATVHAAASAGVAFERPVDRVITDGDLVEVTGPAPGDPVLVSRRWLAQTAKKAKEVRVEPCHPVTGALLDHLPPLDRTTRSEHTDRSGGSDPVTVVVAAAAGFGAEGYRPSTAMARQIRARDRRCRFPGCSIAAVFCDLDHVRPWPHGRTSGDNLICLCRRHHRIKQRPGWTLTLTADGVATWTDPTGRVRTTHPINALISSVLTGPAGTRPQPSTSRARTVIPDGPHSELEFVLEHLGAAPPGHPRAPTLSWPDDHRPGRRHRTELHPRHLTLHPRQLTLTVLDPPGHRSQRRARAATRHPDDDVPPF